MSVAPDEQRQSRPKNQSSAERGPATSPLVTVGMPVYNGGRFLREAIDSVLAQDLGDLELVISDNGSTDETRAIAEAAARRDPRVRYHREPVNRGAAWNFNHTLELARGAYFHWAASDDAFDSSYLRRCVAVLEERPSAVLAYTSAKVVDEHGVRLRTWHPRAGYAGHRGPVDRYRDVLWNGRTCFEVFGVMRTHQVRTTPGIGAFTDSDRSLLTELALMGTFAHVDAPLYTNREHTADSLHTFPRRRDRARWFDPCATVAMPQWRLLRAFASAAWRRAPGLPNRAALLVYVLQWAFGRRRMLVYELATALPWRARNSLRAVLSRSAGPHPGEL